MESKVLRPRYDNSWALVIGINDYVSASPLGYAKNDAEAVGSILPSLGFPAENVTRLFDGDATDQAIRNAYLSFADSRVSVDDRLLVFFAGHGTTRTGQRGEIGYLVPVDGAHEDLASLIRWDELIRNAELIPAKHVLFIMDACYGGLAFTRIAGPGTSRFLKDMLQRTARQALTAGKADEVVADHGGPRPGHSVFTGHLLNGLAGEAASSDGVIGANSLMAYVYDRVSKDLNSRQTPHYGFLDGDGDFIFAAPNLSELDVSPEADTDLLIQVPLDLMQQPGQAAPTLADRTKAYLSDPSKRIALDDLVTQELRTSLALLEPSAFKFDGVPYDSEHVTERMARYGAAVNDLSVITVLMARWAEPQQLAGLSRIFERLCDVNGPQGGIVNWLSLRWYPLTLILYYAGISALSAENWPAFAKIFFTRAATQSSDEPSKAVFAQAISGIAEGDPYDAFKVLPGHERNYAPRSEYLYKAVQPLLEDLLFLGKSYEGLFDRFEILYAMEYAHRRIARGDFVWGPPGRFAWKYRSRGGRSLVTQLEKEAESMGLHWPPLSAGLFDGAAETFLAVSTRFREDLLNKLRWY